MTEAAFGDRSQIAAGGDGVVSIDRLYGGKSTFRLGSWFVAYSKWFAWGIREVRAARARGLPPIRVRIPVNCRSDGPRPTRKPTSGLSLSSDSNRQS